MYRLLIILFPLMVHAEDVKEQKIADISVEDLTNIVRMVVQETLSYCMVTGEMVGRARLNLAVEGEVVARLECDFEEPVSEEKMVEEKAFVYNNENTKVIWTAFKTTDKVGVTGQFTEFEVEGTKNAKAANEVFEGASKYLKVIRSI